MPGQNRSMNPERLSSLLHMLFVARDGTSPYTENLEELIVEALRLTLLVRGVRPIRRTNLEARVRISFQDRRMA